MRLAACARVSLIFRQEAGFRTPAWACAAWKGPCPGMCSADHRARLRPCLVAQGNIPAGKTLSAEDAVPAEVDWAEDSAAVFANAQDFIGMVTARPLTSGQALRQNMVRPPALFTAGSPCR